jgi:PAS domain S-box-containing protein
MDDSFSDKLEIKDLDSAIRIIKESRAGFFKLFNFSPACMSLTNLDRVFVKVNQKFLERFGYTEAEIIGRTSAQIGILDPQESVKVGAILKEKGKLQNDEVICRTKDGREVHTISSIERIEFDGETYLLSTFLDMTHVKHVEEQLRIANKDLEAFSYSVSHDLRAPLRAIKGYSQMLEEGYSSTLDDDAKRLLGVVKNSASKMDKLIEDLLAFSRVGKKKMQASIVDMDLLTRMIVEDISRATTHQATITIDELYNVIGNRDLLSQVWLNLISNAIKYSSKTSHPLINIACERKDKEIVFSVKDNGAGFDMKHAQKLFGVFQRLHSDKDFEGTGVGLTIVDRIVKSHGGKVWAEAKINEGACFYFSLPSA